MTGLQTISCAECARMIVRAEGEKAYPLCAACLSRPGWATDPLMRWLFAPRAEDKPEPEAPPPREPKPRAGAVAILAAIIWTGVIGATVAAIFSGG